MGLIDNESILMSIKRLLNVDPEEIHFDTDIGTFINSEFMTLTQLGIGNPGFYIKDADTRWTDFSDDKSLIQAVKEYVYLRVRMVFDPPASSIVADAYNSKIAELQWRLNIQAEKSWEEYDGGSDASTRGHNEHHFVEGENLVIKGLK